MLSDEPYAAVFGPASQAPYLSETLEKQGELLARYDAVAHERARQRGRADQRPGPDHRNRRQLPDLHGNRADRAPEKTNRSSATGCVYPQSTKTAAGPARGQAPDMARLRRRAWTKRGRVRGRLRPPRPRPEPTRRRARAPAPAPTRPSATRSCTSSRSRAPPRAPRDDVGLRPRSGRTSRPRASTPNLSYIVPDRCHDGNPTPCAPGAPPALAASETFLKTRRPGDHRLEGLQGRRPAGDHRRRGALQRRIRRLELLLRAAALPQPASRTTLRSRRAAARSARCCSRHIVKGGEHERGTVQPLLAAAHDRGHVRAGSPRLRRTPAGQAPATGPLRRKGLTAPRGRRQRSARSW